MRSHTVKAVVFDCDGTLIDSMPAWHQLESDLAWLAGIPLTKQLSDSLNANTLEETIGLFHYNYGVGRSYKQLLESAYQQLLESYRTSVVLRPGVRSFVQALQERDVTLAVLSSSPEPLVRAGLERNGLIDAFDFIVSAQDQKDTKRNPAFVASVASRFQTCFDCIWGFDDSAYALESLRKAGLHTIGIYDSEIAGSFDELSRYADHAIRSFIELDAETFVAGGYDARKAPRNAHAHHQPIAV